MGSQIIKSTKFNTKQKPSRQEAEKAVQTLLRWIGEDPGREGLKETPARFVRAYEEFFAGYDQDPLAELGKTFNDIKDFDDIVMVKAIDFVSHCEHHMVPIIGQAHVAYWPNQHVVGISKLARVVDIFARRLVSQENMTSAIAHAIQTGLQPKGVAVMVQADHQCMSIRGVKKSASSTVTTSFLGVFKDQTEERDRFFKMIEQP